MYIHQKKKVITRKYYIEVVHKNFRLHGTLSKIDFCFFGILGWLLTAILHIVHLLMIITVFIHHKKETAHQYAQFFFGWPTWYMVGENRSLAISFVMLCDWCNANISFSWRNAFTACGVLKYYPCLSRHRLLCNPF